MLDEDLLREAIVEMYMKVTPRPDTLKRIKRAISAYQVENPHDQKNPTTACRNPRSVQKFLVGPDMAGRIKGRS